MKNSLDWSRNFGRTLWYSLWRVPFYREARRRPVRETVGYLAVLLAIFWMLPGAITFFIGMRQALDAVNMHLRKDVPAGATFEIKDGKLATNLSEPVVVRDRQAKTAFIVNTATSTMMLGSDEVGLVMNPDGMVQKKAPDQAEAVSYKSFPNGKTTKEGIEDWLGRYAAWLILLAAIVILLAVGLGMALWYGATTLSYGFIAWLVMKMLKRPVPYVVAWSVAAYAATLLIVIRSVFYWAGFDLGIIPTALYWALLGFVLYDMRKEGGAHDAQDDQKHASATPSHGDGSAGSPGA